MGKFCDAAENEEMTQRGEESQEPRVTFRRGRVDRAG